MNKVIIKNAVLGILLFGSASFATAQTSVKKSQDIQMTQQQVNPAIEALK